MLDAIISLASYGSFNSGGFGNVLAQWESLGVFSYVLPFLLIFAIVFVVLSSLNIFKENKGVNAVISLSVALMSLQFDLVAVFFSEIFPRFGIALAIILVLVIVSGLFIDSENDKGFRWLFAIIGIVIMAVVVFKSLSAYGWRIGD